MLPTVLGWIGSPNEIQERVIWGLETDVGQRSSDVY